jgi:hypothetical protein
MFVDGPQSTVDGLKRVAKDTATGFDHDNGADHACVYACDHAYETRRRETRGNGNYACERDGEGDRDRPIADPWGQLRGEKPSA